MPNFTHGLAAWIAPAISLDQLVDVVPPPVGPVGEAGAVPRERRVVVEVLAGRPGTGRSSRRSARRRCRTGGPRPASRPRRTARTCRDAGVVVELARRTGDDPSPGAGRAGGRGERRSAVGRRIDDPVRVEPGVELQVARVRLGDQRTPAGPSRGRGPGVPVSHSDHGSYGDGQNASAVGRTCTKTALRLAPTRRSSQPR